MAIPAEDYQWIALRLPDGLDQDESFQKNGVDLTVAAAVEQAWDDHDGETGQRYHALADVFEILAGDVKWERERHGDSAYDKSVMLDRATYWRRRAESQSADPATFSMVDIDRGRRTATADEFEQP